MSLRTQEHLWCRTTVLNLIEQVRTVLKKFSLRGREKKYDCLSSRKFFRLLKIFDNVATNPENISRHVSLFALAGTPQQSKPPFGSLLLVPSPQHHHCIALYHRQLVIVIGIEIVQSIHDTTVHYTQFLLNA